VNAVFGFLGVIALLTITWMVLATAGAWIIIQTDYSCRRPSIVARHHHYVCVVDEATP
jgi:hypothetical protein